MQRPDFRTISDFRKRHSEALRGLFVQVLWLCREAGLVKLGHVALDGTKIKANTSKHKAMSYARMVEAEPKLATEVAHWLKTAGRVDGAENRKHGVERRGDETPDWVANKQRRLEKIREAKAALEAEAQAADAGKSSGADKDAPSPPPGKAQHNFTDPQSRIMKTKDGFIQGFNAQAAVDATAQIIVAELLSNQGSDSPQLVGLVEQITTNLAAAPEQVSADAGYCSEDNLEALERRKIDAHIATGRQKHGAPAPQARPLQPESRAPPAAPQARPLQPESRAPPAAPQIAPASTTDSPTNSASSTCVVLGVRPISRPAKSPHGTARNLAPNPLPSSNLLSRTGSLNVRVLGLVSG